MFFIYHHINDLQNIVRKQVTIYLSQRLMFQRQRARLPPSGSQSRSFANWPAKGNPIRFAHTRFTGQTWSRTLCHHLRNQWWRVCILKANVLAVLLTDVRQSTFPDIKIILKQKQNMCVWQNKNARNLNDSRRFEIFLRRERDSNPRRLAPQRFSRPPQSTTLPSLQGQN